MVKIEQNGNVTSGLQARTDDERPAICSKLRMLNPKIVVVPGKHGIFLACIFGCQTIQTRPLTGSCILAAYRLPVVSSACPPKRFVNAWGGSARGYLETLRLLVDHGHATASKGDAGFRFSLEVCLNIFAYHNSYNGVSAYRVWQPEIRQGSWREMCGFSPSSLTTWKCR